MFHRYGKKTKTAATKPLQELSRFIPAPQLLAEEKRSLLLEKIKLRCAFEEEGFNSLCLSLLHNLANHCQNLPETSNSYYAQLGGLLDHALERTEAALELFQHYLMQGTETHELSEEQKLWQYALFSAALLQGIGKLQIDFRIELHDNQGQLLRPWNPLLEPMTTVGGYYSYHFQKESDEEFRRRLNLLIARLLMPTSGFTRIASNSQVLAVWLALLNEDLQAAGTLGALLKRADAIALQRYFDQMIGGYGARGGRYGRADSFAGNQPVSLAELEQQMGIEFIQWLTKSLESGQIHINKAPLYMVPGGLLMSVEMFRLFVREHPEYKNWLAVQNGFLSLGLHQVGTEGNPMSRFEQHTNQQMHEGIVFSQYALVLPEQVQVHNLNTGKSERFSAIEVIHQAQNNHYFNRQHLVNKTQTLAHLTASGQWEIPSQQHTSSLQPGSFKGG